MKKNLWPVISAVLLTAFTTYITMDTFVISKSYNTNATEMNTAMFADIESSSVTSDESASESADDSADASSDSTTSKHGKGSGRQNSPPAQSV